MRCFLTFLIFISLASNTSGKFGLWGTACNDDGFYFPFEKSSAPLVVNDNQIVVSIHSNIKSDIVEVYLDGPLDLGRGGMNIKWDNIDRNKKIAEFDYKDQSGHLKWLGFFDKKKHAYFWSKEPDFVQSYSHDGIVNMKKCE